MCPYSSTIRGDMLELPCVMVQALSSNSTKAHAPGRLSSFSSAFRSQQHCGTSRGDMLESACLMLALRGKSSAPGCLKFRVLSGQVVTNATAMTALVAVALSQILISQ